MPPSEAKRVGLYERSLQFAVLAFALSGIYVAMALSFRWSEIHRVVMPIVQEELDLCAELPEMAEALLAIRAEAAEFHRQRTSAWLLLIAAVLTGIGAGLTLWRKGHLAAAILAPAIVVPVLFTFQAAMAGILFLFAAQFALLSQRAHNAAGAVDDGFWMERPAVVGVALLEGLVALWLVGGVFLERSFLPTPNQMAAERMREVEDLKELVAQQGAAAEVVKELERKLERLAKENPESGDLVDAPIKRPAKTLSGPLDVPGYITARELAHQAAANPQGAKGLKGLNVHGIVASTQTVPLGGGRVLVVPVLYGTDKVHVQCIGAERSDAKVGDEIVCFGDVLQLEGELVVFSCLKRSREWTPLVVSARDFVLRDSGSIQQDAKLWLDLAGRYVIVSGEVAKVEGELPSWKVRLVGDAQRVVECSLADTKAKPPLAGERVAIKGVFESVLSSEPGVPRRLVLAKCITLPVDSAPTTGK
jgi:hypothetical protein